MAFSGKVAVLMGGCGSERDVSLNSGRNVTQALKSEGIDAVGVDITPQDISILDNPSIDVFFIMLHGRWGEDGSLQKILEDKGLKFTGSGSKASKIAFDKTASKEIFVKAGIPTPLWISVEGGSGLSLAESELQKLGMKFVVKPACEGSSVGVEIHADKAAAVKAAKACAAKYGKTLIEQYIKAREFTVGILDGAALPVIEICSSAGFYDFNAKYIAEDTKYLFDTIENAEIVKKMQVCAQNCFEAIGCKGFARVDFLMEPNGCFYVLEINTIPGFTSHSLLPKAADKAGISQGRLCRKILETV